MARLVATVEVAMDIERYPDDLLSCIARRKGKKLLRPVRREQLDHGKQLGAKSICFFEAVIGAELAKEGYGQEQCLQVAVSASNDDQGVTTPSGRRTYNQLRTRYTTKTECSHFGDTSGGA
jgi:hypothetical protein